MRSYPHNSPEACLRVVAVVMLADGQLSAVELDVLEREAARRGLRLSRSTVLQVLQQLCEDLQFDQHLTWAEACQLPDTTLRHLLGEVPSPALQALVVELCLAVTMADRYLAEGEGSTMARVLRHWQLNPVQMDPAGLMAA